MANNPLIQRLNRQAAAWAELAAKDTFAGFSLAEFRKRLEALEAVSGEIAQSNAFLSAAIKRRKEAEDEAMKASKRVRNAMSAHPNHGEDSALIRASGFKTESERRSGLTRKSVKSLNAPEKGS